MARATVAKTTQKQGQQTETSSSGELAQRSSLRPDPYGEVLALQGMVGNGAVNRLLRGGRSAVVQAKLTIGQPGDKYEQEADRVAKEVVRRIHNPQPESLQCQSLSEGENKQLRRMTLDELMEQAIGETDPNEDVFDEILSSLPSVQREEIGIIKRRLRESRSEDERTRLRERLREIYESLYPAPQERVQRLCDECRQEPESELQADFETTLNRAKGGGSPLDRAFRAKVEPAMGADFSGVKVHTDAEADQLSQSIHAKAFTTGQDIFFSQGSYEPRSQQGRELLLHELTHVVQQIQTSRLQIQLREGGHNWLEQAVLERTIPERLSEIGTRAHMSSEGELIQSHDQLFNVMVPTNPWRGYDRENVRRASLGGAIFELLAQTPWETSGDVAREAWGGTEASMGLFQAYPQYVARALTNPALRQWMWEHGDPTARQFLGSLQPPGGELPREQRPTMTPYQAPRVRPPLGLMMESFIRRSLRGMASPIMDSFYLSLAGKIQHTLSAIMELDQANPVMRILPQSQQLRIRMDYETNDCDHGFYARGDFQNEHESRGVGELIDLHSYGSAQRHVMAHLGFSVWEGAEIPNPPRNAT